MGVVYDLRGDGKSAIKVAANKYLLGQTLNGFGVSPNPVNALADVHDPQLGRHQPQLRRRLQSGESEGRRTSRRSGGDNCGPIAEQRVRHDRSAVRRSIPTC